MNTSNNHKRCWSFIVTMKSLIAIALVGAVIGCGDFSDDDDEVLVLSNGYAWTDAHEFPSRQRDGFVFQKDGTLWSISDAMGTWEIKGYSEYHVDGYKITAPEFGRASYTIVNDTLILTILGEPITVMTLVKTWVGILSVNNNGGSLVLQAGQAWTDAHVSAPGERDGFVFFADNTFISINDYYGIWIVDDVGTWYTDNKNKIIMYSSLDGYVWTVPYNITKSILDINGWELSITNNVGITFFAAKRPVHITAKSIRVRKTDKITK